MKLSTKYILFVIFIHLVALIPTWFIFKNNKVFFIITEALVIISLIIAAQLYKALIKPLKYLMQGVEAIKDRDFNVKFLPTGKYEVDRLIGVYNQMIEELRKERTRQEQQHFFLEKLIHTSPTGIVILDYDNRITHLNPMAVQVLSAGATQVVGRLITDLEHPLFKRLAELQTGNSLTVKPDGISTFKLQKAHFIDRGFARQFIMIEELTAEILAAEKNVYGKVIRMMAHEVNNTVGPVNSIMQSALSADQLWAQHNFNPVKDALQVAIDRNQNLNLFMRNFAELVKLPLPNKKPLALHQLLNNVVQLMTINAQNKGVVFETDLPPSPVIIHADEQLMEQALINIVKNSIEAINNTNGIIQFTLKADKRQLVIADNGQGISDADSVNLFSPFFSTKKDGQGIGLTLVREILLSHGFGCSLKSGTDGWTAFTVEF